MNEKVLSILIPSASVLFLLQGSAAEAIKAKELVIRAGVVYTGLAYSLVFYDSLTLFKIVKPHPDALILKAYWCPICVR